MPTHEYRIEGPDNEKMDVFRTTCLRFRPPFVQTEYYAEVSDNGYIERYPETGTFHVNRVEDAPIICATEHKLASELFDVDILEFTKENSFSLYGLIKHLFNIVEGQAISLDSKNRAYAEIHAELERIRVAPPSDIDTLVNEGTLLGERALAIAESTQARYMILKKHLGPECEERLRRVGFDITQVLEELAREYQLSLRQAHEDVETALELSGGYEQRVLELETGQLTDNVDSSIPDLLSGLSRDERNLAETLFKEGLPEKYKGVPTLSTGSDTFVDTAKIIPGFSSSSENHTMPASSRKALAAIADTGYVLKMHWRGGANSRISATGMRTVSVVEEGGDYSLKLRLPYENTHMDIIVTTNAENPRQAEYIAHVVGSKLPLKRKQKPIIKSR